MPKLKQMVKRVEIESAQRTRKCKFTGNDILKDSLCMVVYEDSRNRNRYCYSKDIAIKMIEDARKRLDELDKQLRSDV